MATTRCGAGVENHEILNGNFYEISPFYHCLCDRDWLDPSDGFFHHCRLLRRRSLLPLASGVLQYCPLKGS
jgi:hypothetical protein